MTPVLTPSGLLLASVGVIFCVCGAFVPSWPLVALGMSLISAMFVLYILCLPAGVMLKRRQLEFAWWVPPGELGGGALTTDRPMTLHLLLRNRAPLRLIVARLRIVTSSSITIDAPPGATLLLPRREIYLQIRATPLRAGYWFFFGMSLQITDRFGLFALHLYYPNLMGIKVFPHLGAPRAPIPFRPRTGAFHERAGQRTVRQPGLGSDLREIRDHIPGDPFKRMAWKATARRNKLMVREFESEILVTHWILLDISSTMRANDPGKTKLDHAISLCAQFARLALEAGDRVGLITFDHRIVDTVKPSDGNPQLYRIIESLMELFRIVDEDLTDLTEAELYAAVAEYLRFQEGINVVRHGRPPGPRDPVWSRLIRGPRGELYDADLTDLTATRILRQRSRQHSQRVTGGNRLTRLRRFCRENGLEIPYRQHSFLRGKEHGMFEAIHRAGASRHSQFMLLVTDLEEVTEQQKVIDALRLARRRHHSLTVVTPLSPPTDPSHGDPNGLRVHNILELRAQRQRRTVRSSIAKLGIPVLAATAHDALPVLMRRLSRLRGQLSGTG